MSASANQDVERFYNLLPAVYRNRDAAQDEPLRALLAVIEGEFQRIESDIEGLYDDWFIETCEEWVVPYIADLLGVRPLHAVESTGAYSLRAYVANTLRYRRRKGTAAVLEQLARDVTGWPARAVEFFQLLETTQHLNHVRLGNVRTPDLRRTNELELLGTPFATAAHTAEVRRIATGRGKYNIPNVGLFLWRLQSYAVTRGSARAVTEPADGRYWFSPLGLDMPLFNRPQTETEITHLAEEINVPGILRRRALYDDLEALRQSLVGGGTARTRYFDKQSVLQIFLDEQFVDGQPVPVPPEEILICDLSDWRRPPTTIEYERVTTQPDGTQVIDQIPRPITVAVDPKLGRLTFPVGGEPTQVHVSYAYGFSGDVGGGPYSRRESVTQVLTREVTWQVGVAQSPEIAPVGGEQIFPDLTEAVQEWNAQPPGTVGVIAILDSYSYRETLTGVNAIELKAGSQLLIVAATWPQTDVPGSTSNEQERRLGRLEPTGLYPHVWGDIAVRGTTLEEDANAGELILDGLLVEGDVQVLLGNLGSLQLNHCTLVPTAQGLMVNASAVNALQENNRLRVQLNRAIVGAIRLAATVPTLQIVDSIVDRPGDVAIAASGAEAIIDTSTILGRTAVRTLDGSESIFLEPIVAERRQQGCVRFSFLAEGSRTPRRHRCQPDLALEGVTDPAEASAIRTRLTPFFTANDYGDPAYLQLSQRCAIEIQTGAEDGAEMGVFHHLQQPQRIANLRVALDEYLPFGLEAGIFSE